MERPYAPSWIDSLTERIERLPFPAWLFYVALAAIVTLAGHLVAWTQGMVPWWTPYDRVLLLGFWAGYAPGFIHYTDNVAADACQAFHTALDATRETHAQLVYRFTTMPRDPVWLVSAAGLFLIWWAIRLTPHLMEPVYATTVSTVFFTSILYAENIVNAVLFYHVIRQMVLVSQTYGRVRQVDVFNLSPLYAFSGLTARTAIGWGLVIYGGLVIQPDLAQNPLWVAFVAMAVATIIPTFLWPLWGIHRRIEEEKARKQIEANRRLELAFADLHRRMDEGRLDNLTQVQAGLASLVIERDTLDKIPTWPWKPGTLRGFISALLLPLAVPLAVWIIQRLVERFWPSL